MIKVCGLTTPEDVDGCVEAGVTAIGINLWSGSPRSVSWETAEVLVRHTAGRLVTVALLVDPEAGEVTRARDGLGVDLVQLHGGTIAPDAPWLFRAVGLATVEDSRRALEAKGPWVLVDAKDEVRRGGTGRPPPASLTAVVCRSRPTVLAGGLSPENVGEAIARYAPVGVDAASGLETSPGQKDQGKVQRYVAAARGAFSRLGDRALFGPGVTKEARDV